MLRSRFAIPAAFAGLFFAASGFENRAANSVSIRAGSAVDQLRRIRSGSTVFMSLGTNDAVGSIKGLEKGIDRIVETARASNLKLIWIGPPCVSKPWDSRSLELDGILRARLAGTNITYVSMRDPSLCTPSVRASDGVHFNMDGYRAMWSRTASASGYQVASLGRETPHNNTSKKKQRREEVAVQRDSQQQSQEAPRFRTTVTATTLFPLSAFAPAPAPQQRQKKKTGGIGGEYFSFGFRWPDTVRSSGHNFPND